MDRNDIQDAIAQASAPSDDQATGFHDVAGAIADAEGSNVTPATRMDKFTTGLSDLGYGSAQLVEHTPGLRDVAEGYRSIIRSGLNAIGQKDAASLFDSVDADKFDDIVKDREKAYQDSRKSAGDTGFDWFRLAGNVANPVNYLSGGGPAAATAAGRIITGAKLGAGLSASQPTAGDGGSYWWEKSKDALTGALTGGGLSTAVEGALPLIRSGIQAVRSKLGPSANASGAADTVINSALNASRIDPDQVSPNVLSGLRQEVSDALTTGASPNPLSISNRAIAESLPVPIQLTRGQASRDPGLFEQEFNLKSVKGVGEPLQAFMNGQEGAAVRNLDAMGAQGAPTVAQTGNTIAGRVGQYWDGLKTNERNLWNAVRTSNGQPAAMDGFTAARNIRETLDTPQSSYAFRNLPSGAQQVINDLEDGHFNLDVASMQQLDHAWSTMARGATDPAQRFALNSARRTLSEAPIQGDLGPQAVQAWQLAKQATAQLHSMLEPKTSAGLPNPNYQPLLDHVIQKGTAPEKLMDKTLLNEPASVATRNLNFLSQIDPDAPRYVGNTIMGKIKSDVLGGRDESAGKVSEAKLKDAANNETIQALLPRPLGATLNGLARTITNIKFAPPASTPNYSGSGAAVINAGIATGGRMLGALTSRLPIVHQVVAPLQEGMREAVSRTNVQESMTPSVTLKSLLSATPRQAQKNLTLSRLATPIALDVLKDKNSGSSDDENSNR